MKFLTGPVIPLVSSYVYALRHSSVLAAKLKAVLVGIFLVMHLNVYLRGHARQRADFVWLPVAGDSDIIKATPAEG